MLCYSIAVVRAQTTRTWTTRARRRAGARCTRTGSRRACCNRWTCRSWTTRTAPRPITRANWSRTTCCARATRRAARTRARATAAARSWGWPRTNRRDTKSSVRIYRKRLPRIAAYRPATGERACGATLVWSKIIWICSFFFFKNVL